MKKFLIFSNLVVIFFFCSCHKNSPEISNPPITEQLSLNLDKRYLDSNTIDSAVAVWVHNGNTQSTQLTMQDGKLVADLHRFEEGNGILTLQIFTKAKFNYQYPWKWIQEKQIALDHSKNIELQSPSGFKDDKWLPQVMLSDVIGHSAVVALRPEDSYFQIACEQDDVKELEVNRSYWNTNGIVKVAEGTWHCSGECTKEQKGVSDTSFFSFLPGQIGSREWNHLEIVILFKTDEHGGGYVLSLAQDVK